MASKPARAQKTKARTRKPELVVITGLSGSGKGSVLRALEDLGFYSVDNLPVELIPKFAELTRDNPSIHGAALVVDVREGKGLKRFPEIFGGIRKSVGRPAGLPGGGRRGHSSAASAKPAGLTRWAPTARSPKSIRSERAQLAPIRAMADLIINTSKFTVHELREFIGERFRGQRDRGEHHDLRHQLRLPQRCAAGQRPGVRCPVSAQSQLHSPLQESHGKAIPGWREYIRSFPQTAEFIKRITDLLIYLLPHYIREGKSYLTICLRLHRRAAPLGDDGRPDPQESRGSRLQG